jgi:hypothetical protein
VAAQFAVAEQRLGFRGDRLQLAVETKLHDVDRPTVRDQHVVSRPLAPERMAEVLGVVLVRPKLLVLVHHLAGPGIECVEVDAAVKVGRPTRGDVGQAVKHHQRAVHRPHGLQLAVGLDQSFVRRRAKSPSQRVVGSVQAVDVSIGRGWRG